LEDLDKEVFPTVIPVTDEQERFKEANKNLDFSGNGISTNLTNQE